jgi:hypothetical protein
MERYGTSGYMRAENMYFGQTSKMMQLKDTLFVSNQTQRDYRANLFNPNIKFTGVATCPHSKFGIMTVINYAESFKLSAGGTYAI